MDATGERVRNGKAFSKMKPSPSLLFAILVRTACAPGGPQATRAGAGRR
jgi:hypothetical protein